MTRFPTRAGLTRRGLLGGALGAAALLGTAGCGDDSGGGDGSKTLVFWHNFSQQARADFLRRTADAFEQANPGVTVKIEVVPFGQIPTKWPAAQAAGTLPDVTTLLPEHAVSMWQAKALHPMGDVLSALGGGSVFTPGLVDKFAVYDGEPILLPYYVHNRLLTYRTDLLAAAGVTLPESPTWDQTLAAATAMTKAPNTYGWMLKLATSDTGGSYLLSMLTRSTGGRIFDGTGKSMLTTAEVRRAADFIVQIARTASGPGQVNYTISDGFNLINSGKTAISEESAAVIATAVQQAPDVATKLATTFMPRDTAPGHLLGAISVALPKGKNPTLAREFVKFLYAKQNYVPFLHTIPLFMFPTLTAASGDEFFGNPTIKKYEPTVRQTLTGIKEGSAPGFEDGPNPYAGPAISGHAIEKALQSILVGGVSVTDALSRANKELQATFDTVRTRTGK
ncbi:ABC transporter substrate-binding protein [Micromonospora echinospora]|uniref:ABC transporter substrate-binding protein n=1 Tax=Micromonospora echinospora TaxID=1877 RepID=UPI003A865D48